MKIMLIDNHNLVRSGLRCILREAENVQIVSEWKDCAEAILGQQTIPAEVAIISLNKFDPHMLKSIQQLMHRLRELKVLVITDYTNDVILAYLLKQGAKGCLSMNTDPAEIQQALKAIKQGECYIGEDIASYLATAQSFAENSSPFTRLSSRELLLVLMMVRGLTSKEIAGELALSPKTINTYRNNIVGKLEVKNEVEMTLLAVQSGLFALEPSPYALHAT